MKVQIHVGGLIVDPGRAPYQVSVGRYSSIERTVQAMVLVHTISHHHLGEAAT